MSSKNNRILTSGDISLMCRQMSMLIKSGVLLSDALDIMRQTASSKRAKELYSQLHDSLEMGETLAEALDKTQQFPEYTVKMIKIGDRSGKLDSVLDALYLYYRRSERIEHSVKSAIVYPLIMVCVMICVIAFIVIKALPVFAQVFVQVGAQMPPFLKALTEGNAALKFLMILGAVIVISVLLYYLLKHTVGGEAFLNKIYENGFLTKKLAEKSNTNKFAFAISMLLSSGINIDEALEMSDALIDSPKMRKKTAQIKADVGNNESFASALTKSGLLSGEHAAMIAVGEKAGKLDEMMNSVAQRNAEEADEWISKLISAIEPTIVIIMSLTVGAILISVMLPLMNIMTGM